MNPLTSHITLVSLLVYSTAPLHAESRAWSNREGKTVSYHVYYPTSYNPDPPPATIIMFSPGGGGKGILGSVKDACETLGWLGGKESLNCAPKMAVAIVNGDSDTANPTIHAL